MKNYCLLALTLVLNVMLFAQSPGDIVITEILQNPACVSDANGEYFEVYNATSSPIDLNGWIIKDKDFDGDTIVNGGPLMIGANQFLTFGIDASSATNGGYVCDYQYGVLGNLFLGNSDDELILKTPAGVTIDSVAWDNGATFPDPNGASMVFVGCASDDNNIGSNWITATVREMSYDLSCTDFGSPRTMGVDQNLTGPAAPVVTTTPTICEGEDAILMVPATNDTVNWYADAGLTTLLDTGEVFNAGPLPAGVNFIWTTLQGACEGPPTQTTIVVLENTSSSINVIECVSYTSPSGNYTWTTSNTYMDTVPNGQGCDSVITVNLTIGINTNVLQSGATLTADIFGATYQWLDCDNAYAVIPGATGQAYTPATTGNYAVEITIGGCTDTSACYLVDYTGIEELSEDGKKLVKIVDLMGRESLPQKNKVLIYVFSDGTIERVFEFK